MELRIKELFKEKGMRMCDLAEKMGINQANLASSLNGNPTLTRLQDVAKVLGVEVYELFVKPSTLSGRLNGYVEIDGEVAKISTEDDWLSATQKMGTIPEPHLYTKASELRKDICDYIHEMVKDYDVSRLLCGRLGHHEMFTITCEEEIVSDVDESEERDLIFHLALVEKNRVIRYSTMEYGIEDCDLDSNQGLIKNLINDLEWPFESMESACEYWD